MSEPDETDDPLANLLSLKLRKPQHWNWELSTSRSCSNIALPRILLYDHAGNLLVDADQSTEKTYRSQEKRKRAATSTLPSARSELSQDLQGLHIVEATPSVSSRSGSRSNNLTGSCIDFNTHELPNWEPTSGSSRRSSSLKSVRFDESKSISPQPVPSYPTPPSTSTLTTSSSGPREKRRYRRSHSSILERFSMSRGRHSSPEYAQEQQVEHGPRYFLRSSKAGTLVIKEDSFGSRQKLRRRRPPRHSSSENVLQERERDRDPAHSAVQVTTRRRAELSTSEEEQEQKELVGERRTTTTTARPSRGRRTQRSCFKDVAQELITVDPDNCVYRAAQGATAR